MAMALILIDTTLKCHDKKTKEQNDSEREKEKQLFLKVLDLNYLPFTWDSNC